MALEALNRNTTSNSIEFVPTTSPFQRVAGEALAAGACVAFDNNAGASEVFLADADHANAARQNPVGFVPVAYALGALATVCTTGELPIPDAQWLTVPAAADVGKTVYLSTAAGRITFDPTVDITAVGANLVRVGIVAQGGAGTSRLAIEIGENVATETGEMILLPEARYQADGTRGDHTVLEGASFRLHKRVQFNQILVRATAQAGAPTLKVLIYQQANGLSGIATLKASVAAFPIPALGNYVLTPAEGTVTLEPGLCYVLFGRDSAAGTFTMRTWGNVTVDLLNANVPGAPTAVHPTTFVTGFAASAANPASINPLVSPTGDAVVSTLNTALVVRLYRL